MNNKKRLFSYLKPFKSLLFLSMVFALFFVVSQLSQPFLLGKALDASRAKNVQDFYVFVFVALGLVLLGVIADYIFEVLVMNVSQKMIKKMRDDLYIKINNISIKDFDMKKHGDIVQLEIKDMENLASGIFAIFKTLLQGLLTIVITILMMMLVNWILALGVILLSPLSMVMARIISRFSRKHYKKQSEIQAKIASISLETLNNLDVVQSLNYEKESLEKFKQVNEELRKEGRITQFSAGWVNPSTRLVNNTIYVIIGVVGIILLSYSKELAVVYAVMSIGRLSSFLNYTNQYSKPFNEVSSVVSEYENAKASLNRINAFLNLENDVDDGKEEIGSIERIEFRNMSFSYDPNIKLIENLNLVISKGHKVAIVGPTGAGKTTLINVLMRFYDPTSGDILINDKSYLSIKKESLRDKIGMVLQDTWIFSGTIFENIAYLKKDATLEEVKEAARKAHADSFIDVLKDSYQTRISSKSGLSEGQKQMLAISRVMLANPDLIILDEATSNIDTRSEKYINDAFDNMTKTKTSIVIAHRLSTIVSADNIIVMNNGQIVEVGKHEELMKKKGFYYSLYSSQYR